MHVNDGISRVLLTYIVRLDVFVSPDWSTTFRLSVYDVDVPSIGGLNVHVLSPTLVMLPTAVPEYVYCTPPVPPVIVLLNVNGWSPLIRHLSAVVGEHVNELTSNVLLTWTVRLEEFVSPDWSLTCSVNAHLHG